MTTLTPERSQPETGDLSWYIVGRWREYEGEARANLLRVAGIAAFYLVELANYRGLDLGFFRLPKVVGREYHLAVTAVAVAWTMMALAVHLCLTRRVFPSALKYASTIGDILFLTCVLAVSNGSASPLISGYFAIAALTTLRFSLPLVQLATFGGMASYLVLIGYAKWFGPETMRVPRYYQILFLLALGFTGIILGQSLRRVKGMAEEYAARRAGGGGVP